MNPVARIILFCLLMVLPLSAQINTYLRGIRPLSVTERLPLSVSVELQQSSELSRVVLYYRQFGQSEFRTQEMQIMRDSAVAEVPSTDVLLPFIEVYVIATTINGEIETFPLENPQVNPARISVDPAPKSEYEIIILSPEEGELVKEGETYVSISFVYADTSIDRSKTKIQLNGIDLSGSMMMFDDLLIVPAEAIPASAISGGANLSVQTYDAYGNEVSSMRRGFTVVTALQAEEIESEFQGAGNAQAESRNENIKGTKKTYNRLDTRANGTYAKFLRAVAQVTVTSEEKPENQPQNRYYFGLDARYAKLGIGDAYPRFPFTIMDGRRVRGYTFDLLLGAFNVNVAQGELLRRVEFNSIPSTLKRDMTIIRPSFGKGEKFQWGFTYMKAKDAFVTEQHSVRPQENVVFGSDVLLAFDDRRIEFTAQTAVSITNVDISSPEFNKDSIDAAIARNSFSASDGDQLKKFLPILKIFITPNENLVPINPVGGTSLVYESGLALNYFGNYLKGTVILHGKDYTSAGASSLRKDIQGFNVIDRLRLLDNRLFLTGSYEQLTNNTAKTEIATTTYKTMNTAISFYPARDFPNVTIGYGVNINSNPINPVPTDTSNIAAQIALRALDDETKRYFLQTSYDFLLWGRHSISFNIDVSDKKDRTIKKQDISTLNTSFLISTVHDQKLESAIGIGISSLTFPQFNSTTQLTEQSSLSYQTISLTGRYKLYEELLRLNATFAPTFGDLARTLFETSLQYNISLHQAIVLQFQFIANSSSSQSVAGISNNDSYLSLMYRIDF
ncbi:MAG: hypothetical protein WCX28_04085 [Bacteriovoracaceae bacterium]|nr:hypothetical protein [Bacteroidota bacterium]